MKNIKSKLIPIFVLLFLFLICSIFGSKIVSAVMTSTGGFQIWADSISMGGAEDALSSSGDFQMRDTFGEPIAGRSSSTINQIRAGFREMERGSFTLNITPSSLDLGDLSTQSTASASGVLTFYSDMAGVSISFSGESLKNGVDYIQSIGPSATSAIPGLSQFGFNAIYSAGDIYAQSMSPYNQVDKYAFNDGSEVIRTDSPMLGDANFNLNYIVNISGSEPAGDYATDLTFTGLASF